MTGVRYLNNICLILFSLRYVRVIESQKHLKFFFVFIIICGLFYNSLSNSDFTSFNDSVIEIKVDFRMIQKWSWPN